MQARQGSRGVNEQNQARPASWRETERRHQLETLARSLGWRLVVLFGSSASGQIGRDLDIAVLPKIRPDLMTLGGWQAQLEDWADPQPVDLLLITPDLSPITGFEVFRAGLCLWEAEDGLFDRERDRAFFLYADTAWMRQQQHEALRNALS